GREGRRSLKPADRQLLCGCESLSTVPAGWSFPFHPAEFLPVTDQILLPRSLRVDPPRSSAGFRSGSSRSEPTRFLPGNNSSTSRGRSLIGPWAGRQTAAEARSEE